MALFTAVMAMLLMLALGAVVTLTTTTETTIAANHRDGVQGLYAAEAAADLAVDRLRSPAVWDALATAATATMVLEGSLADLLQSASLDPRIVVSVSIDPDPDGDHDVLVIESSARGSGAIRRSVQVTVRRRLTEDPSHEPVIETRLWRER